MIIRTVGQVLCGHASHITPKHTVREAARLMDRLDVNALGVLDRGRLVGLVCEYDIVRRCVSKGRPTSVTPVADVMSTEPLVIEKDAPLAQALQHMAQGGFRHLPVLDRGVFSGVLSMRDIPTGYRLMVERFTGPRGIALTG